MNQLFNLLIDTNIVPFTMLIALFVCPKTRVKTFKLIWIFSICLIQITLSNKLRDFETIRLLLKLNIKELIQTLTTRVRLTSSKSLPDLKNLNMKAFIHAIYVRFIMKWISPINRYLAWIKEIWMEIVRLVKLGCNDNRNVYFA